MIAPADKNASKGGLGGQSGPLIPPAIAQSPAATIDERTAGKDLRLIGMAVRKGWAIPDVIMEKLPTKLGLIAMDDGRDDRARINAAKVLVQMHGQNDPAPMAEVNVGVNVSVGDTVQGLLHEPEYLDYLRNSRTVRRNG